jgi:hypothetical protein
MYECLLRSGCCHLTRTGELTVIDTKRSLAPAAEDATKVS